MRENLILSAERCRGVLDNHEAGIQSSVLRQEGRQYVSQRAKLEDFLDAEYGEEVLAVVQRAINELV